MIKVLCVFGTRPEAIKLAPVIRRLRADPQFSCLACCTAQHRHLLDLTLEAFDLRSDIDLGIMRPRQDLSHITTQILEGLAPVLRDWRPDWTVVQGDTSTTFSAALAAFYAKIPIGHVEAGLRTGRKHAPFPEEVNRRATAVYADMHFAPTESARQNLLRESIPDDRIWVTGNTGIDALRWGIAKLEESELLASNMRHRFAFLDPNKRLILVTAHRRESFGSGLEQICWALRDIAEAHKDVQIVYPVHLNPNVRSPVNNILGPVSEIVGIRPNGAVRDSSLYLIEPVDYLSMVWLLNRSFFVLSDSGGIQEEGPSLGRPVLVLRDETERQEAIEAGASRLVGTDHHTIVSNVTELLEDIDAYDQMARPTTAFGDGGAAERIALVLAESFVAP